MFANREHALKAKIDRLYEAISYCPYSDTELLAELKRRLIEAQRELAKILAGMAR